MSTMILLVSHYSQLQSVSPQGSGNRPCGSTGGATSIGWRDGLPLCQTLAPSQGWTMRWTGVRLFCFPRRIVRLCMYASEADGAAPWAWRPCWHIHQARDSCNWCRGPHRAQPSAPGHVSIPSQQCSIGRLTPTAMFGAAGPAAAMRDRLPNGPRPRETAEAGGNHARREVDLGPQDARGMS